MRQAICLLAYKDIDYIKKFIDQFENNKDIYFYIHWHTHSEFECNELKKYSSNIKYVVNKFKSRRFSYNLIYAELYLYELALNDDMEYFHLMSESDYIICSPQYFCDYFDLNKDKNFVGYLTNKKIQKLNERYINELKYPLIKASQWKSLCKQTTYELINNLKNEIDVVIKCYDNMTRWNDYMQYGWGAPDEYIIPTIFHHLMNVKSDTNMRYISWENINMYVDHPNVLTYSLLNNESYPNINEKLICKNLIIRKIDIKNEDCIKLLNYLLLKFKDYNIYETI